MFFVSGGLKDGVVRTIKPEIEALLIDKDGPLVDPNCTWGEYYAKTMSEIGALSGVSAYEIAQFSGFDLHEKRVLRTDSVLLTGSTDLVLKMWCEVSGLGYESVKKIAENNYGIVEAAPSVPAVSDIRRTFQEFASEVSHMGIATNDCLRFAEKAVRDFGIGRHVPHVFAADQNYRRKPFPDMLHAFSDATGIEPQNIAVIGDSNVDMQMACGGGGWPVGVLTGRGDSKILEQAGAWKIVPDLSYVRREIF